MEQPEKPYLLESSDYDVDVSIVVPAYNEEARLTTMMTDTLKVWMLDVNSMVVLERED